MKRPRNDLNDEQNALFDERIKHWQNIFGLNDWRVERSNRSTSAMAEVLIKHGPRLATYKTGDFGAAEINAESIDDTALHEMAHLFLAELLNTAATTDDPVLLETAEHRVVNTLEKLLKGRA
jgi:hypothetical protein